MAEKAAFIMPVKIRGNETELRLLREAVESIKNQTAPDWVLVMVNDFSDDAQVDAALAEICADLGERAELIDLEKNVGAGEARNVAIRRAAELGAPFLLFNDSDDISDPRRLELVRRAFEADETANVVYLSFDVIDEFGRTTPHEDICLSVREIIDGHQRDIVEGENAWVQIAMKKKYTNLTSCTAVRTWLAVKEPFPKRSVSEDGHTWFRYGAYPGKFVFLREIKNHYRICSGVESRSRSNNDDFYGQMATVDREGFEAAMKLAEGFGTVKPEEENDIRTAFYVRLALSQLYGDTEVGAEKLLRSAMALSPARTVEAIAALDCGEEWKDKLRSLAE
jgi:glycosyltransferase involved in cell wall biosynthesis